MENILEHLEKEGVRRELIEKVRAFSEAHPADEALRDRVPAPDTFYYGNKVWEEALAALLAGKNILLAGPKATGKNILAENLAAVFGRPAWNISFHISTDAAALVGTDTYDGQKVVFREGPITRSAKCGGFAILDEINMARNEALAVLHSALDFRRVIDVPGYELIRVSPETRFIGTMNYGYAGTRDLNEALASRFAVIMMPAITEEDLMRLLERKFPGLKNKAAGQFAKLWGEIARKAEKAEISERALDLRGLLDAVSLIENGLTSGEALAMCIVNKSFDAYERTLISDVIAARIPADLTAADIFER